MFYLSSSLHFLIKIIINQKRLWGFVKQQSNTIQHEKTKCAGWAGGNDTQDLKSQVLNVQMPTGICL